mmetsp:Transcript_113026/g.324836  ORF Transcript_113026/g.324836 Transcript_113026/m.324836 type:complete len:226 (-) Transcript_113026:100-777(-)
MFVGHWGVAHTFENTSARMHCRCLRGSLRRRRLPFVSIVAGRLVANAENAAYGDAGVVDMLYEEPREGLAPSVRFDSQRVHGHDFADFPILVGRVAHSHNITHLPIARLAVGRSKRNTGGCHVSFRSGTMADRHPRLAARRGLGAVANVHRIRAQPQRLQPHLCVLKEIAAFWDAWKVRLHASDILKLQRLRSLLASLEVVDRLEAQPGAVTSGNELEGVLNVRH